MYRSGGQHQGGQPLDTLLKAWGPAGVWQGLEGAQLKHRRLLRLQPLCPGRGGQRSGHGEHSGHSRAPQHPLLLQQPVWPHAGAHACCPVSCRAHIPVQRAAATQSISLPVPCLTACVAGSAGRAGMVKLSSTSFFLSRLCSRAEKHISSLIDRHSLMAPRTTCKPVRSWPCSWAQAPSLP